MITLIPLGARLGGSFDRSDLSNSRTLPIQERSEHTNSRTLKILGRSEHTNSRTQQNFRSIRSLEQTNTYNLCRSDHTNSHTQKFI